MIHVCFGLHDKTGRYSKFTGTEMTSIFENISTPPRLPSVTVHILHDNTLTLNNREKFSYVAGQYNQLVKFYNVEELCADKVSEMVRLIPLAKTSRLSVAALYRLLIPQLLPADIDKCIYLDSDIIVNMNIVDLWQIDLDNKPIAAAAEVEADSFSHPHNAANNYLVTSGIVNYNDYFNSGVLLMNLNVLRKEEDTLLAGIKFVGDNPQLQYLDQEVLNYLYSKNYLKLDAKFNFFVRESRSKNETNTYRRIYHFAGGEFNLNINDPFNRLWMKHFIRTPWFNEETIGQLYAGFQQIHVGLKNSMVNVSAMMSGKTRAFFTLPQNVEATKAIFHIQPDEEILLADNQESLQKLADSMNASRGKKVFFILLPNFPFQALIQAGFVYGKDFISGFEFLSEAHGLPFNSYPLIQAM